MLGRVADLALTGQEDERIARTLAPQLVDRIADRFVEPVLAALFEWPPTLLDREHSARHLDHRRRSVARFEVLRESVGIDRRRRDDDFQIGPPRQDLLQVAEQEVDVQTALMRLVDDQRVVRQQPRVGLRFGEQDAVGHQLDARARSEPILEAHLEADDLAKRRLQLVGNALGHTRRSDAPRLRVADQAAPACALAASHRERNLRQLRRLARAGFAADDHHLIRRDGRADFVAPRRHRQRLGEANRGNRVRHRRGLGARGRGHRAFVQNR